jgi:hypothetical protein
MAVDTSVAQTLMIGIASGSIPKPCLKPRRQLSVRAQALPGRSRASLSQSTTPAAGTVNHSFTNGYRFLILA